MVTPYRTIKANTKCFFLETIINFNILTNDDVDNDDVGACDRSCVSKLKSYKYANIRKINKKPLLVSVSIDAFAKKF